MAAMLVIIYFKKYFFYKYIQNKLLIKFVTGLSLFFQLKIVYYYTYDISLAKKVFIIKINYISLYNLNFSLRNTVI